jgi:hypothetical protein
VANPTTNLNITLPTVGGSSNTWGTILNDAFQSLDDVFAAGAAVSLDINGGTMDNVVIGGTTASAASFTSVTIGASAASAGAVRMANAAAVAFRNAGGTADIDALSVDASNIVKLGADTDAASVLIGASSVPTTVVGNATLSGNLIHNNSTATVGFYGVTPTTQQQSTSSPLSLSATYASDYQDIENAINELRLILLNLGLLKN